MTDFIRQVLVTFGVLTIITLIGAAAGWALEKLGITANKENE